MSKKAKLPKFLTIPRMSCALLSIVMIGLQFLPFWNVGGEAGKLSISDVVWLIYNHPEAKTFFTQNFGATTTINSVILIPVFIFAACVVTFVLSFVMESVWYTIAPAIAFILTVVGYLARPELRAGDGWFFHFIPTTIMAVFVVTEFLGTFRKKED